MTKNIILLLSFFLVTISAFSQTETPKKKNTRHSVFFEVLGYTGAYSINYDVAIYQKSKHGMSLRVGYAYLNNKINNYDFIINKAHNIPASLNWFWGTQNFYMGIGAGVIASSIDYGDTPYLDSLPYTYTGEDDFKILPVANLNFRYQPQQGLFFQIIATTLEDSPFGVGIGWSF